MARKRMGYGIQPRETETEKKNRMFDRLFGRQVAEMLKRQMYAEFGLNHEDFLKKALAIREKFEPYEKKKIISIKGEVPTVSVIKAMAEGFSLDGFPVRQKRKIQRVFNAYVSEKEKRIGAP